VDNEQEIKGISFIFEDDSGASYNYETYEVPADARIKVYSLSNTDIGISDVSKIKKVSLRFIYGKGRTTESLDEFEILTTEPCQGDMCEIIDNCNIAEGVLGSIKPKNNIGSSFDLDQEKIYSYCGNGYYIMGGGGEGVTCNNPECKKIYYYEYEGPIYSEGKGSGWGSLIDAGSFNIIYETTRTTAICIPNNANTRKFFSVYIRNSSAGEQKYFLNQANSIALCNEGDEVISGAGYAPACDEPSNSSQPVCGKISTLEFNGPVEVNGIKGWKSVYNVDNNFIDDTVQTFAICLKKTSLFDDYMKIYHVVNEGADYHDQDRTSVYCEEGDIAVAGGGSLCDNNYICKDNINYLEKNRVIYDSNKQGWTTVYDLKNDNVKDTYRVVVTCLGIKKINIDEGGKC
jgi:hypothetical protein